MDDRQLKEGDWPEQHSLRIIGVDEAGRGPLAGPLVVGAVEYPWVWASEEADWLRLSVRDSKELTPKTRELLHDHIMANCRAAWVSIDAAILDRDGITSSVNRAACMAIMEVLKITEDDNDVPPLDYVVLDGKAATWGFTRFPVPQRVRDRIRFMVRGDKHVAAISAASIIAKVAHDAEMRRLSYLYPEYGFDQHQGYGTPQHLEALKQHGPINGIHRFSFRPVAELANG